MRGSGGGGRRYKEIDDAMTEEYGAHENNVLWTRENLRKLKDSIVDKIKSKLNK